MRDDFYVHDNDIWYGRDFVKCLPCTGIQYGLQQGHSKKALRILAQFGKRFISMSHTPYYSNSHCPTMLENLRSQ